MQGRRQNLKPSLKTVLVESRVATVAIMVLLFWTVYAGVQFVSYPLYNLFAWLVTAVLILDIPYIPRRLTVWDQLLLITSLWNLALAVTSFAAASGLSKWLFNTSPVETLRKCHSFLRKENE